MKYFTSDDMTFLYFTSDDMVLELLFYLFTFFKNKKKRRGKKNLPLGSALPGVPCSLGTSCICRICSLLLTCTNGKRWLIKVSYQTLAKYTR